MKILIKKIFYQFIFFLLLISVTEIFLGDWFKSDGFGSTIRNGRLKNQIYEVEYGGKIYEFFYKKNFYGFRGDDIDPKKIKNFFIGASQGAEKFKPEEFTIIGRLNSYLEQENLKNKKIYNASQDGFSTFGILNYLSKFYPKIKNFNPEKLILYIGVNDGELCNNFISSKSEDEFQSHLVWDTMIEKNKIKLIKDYLKNTSFFLTKLKMIQLKYFSRKKQKIQTSANTENFINLQANTKYINYFNAKNFHSKKKLENKFAPCKKRLIKNLTQIIDFSKKHKIEILLINNINYKGVNDDWLYYTNSIISDFAEKYSLSFIDLSKIRNIGDSDFYDDQHTTIKGSEKIAKFIYPEVRKFLITNNNN